MQAITVTCTCCRRPVYLLTSIASTFEHSPGEHRLGPQGQEIHYGEDCRCVDSWCNRCRACEGHCICGTADEVRMLREVSKAMDRPRWAPYQDATGRTIHPGGQRTPIETVSSTPAHPDPIPVRRRAINVDVPATPDSVLTDEERGRVFDMIAAGEFDEMVQRRSRVLCDDPSGESIQRMVENGSFDVSVNNRARALGYMRVMEHESISPEATERLEQMFAGWARDRNMIPRSELEERGYVWRHGAGIFNPDDWEFTLHVDRESIMEGGWRVRYQGGTRDITYAMGSGATLKKAMIRMVKDSTFDRIKEVEEHAHD